MPTLKWLGLLLSLCPVFAQDAPAPPTTGTIGGIVRDGRTNAPMPDVRVQLAGKTTRRTPTDPDGRFLFEDLNPGVYGLQVNPPSGAALLARKTVSVAAGQTVDLEILAEASAQLFGRVLDQDGEPVSGMAVSLRIPPSECGHER